MKLRSAAFRDGEEIPRKYTQDGENLSPPLSWDDVPRDAESLALVVEDPDAPQHTWIHWVLLDLPFDSKGLPEGLRHLHNGVVGRNDWDRPGWNGPAPPSGRHRYVFTLYALDRPLRIKNPTKADFERALANARVLAQAKLTGTYQRQRAA